MRKIILSITILSVLLIAGYAYAVPVFEEDFSGSALPSGWNFDTDGLWSVENGELSQSRTSTNAHADCSAGDESWINYSMQTRFQYIAFGSNNMEAGVSIRAVNGQGGTTIRTSWRGGSEGWNLELMRSGMSEWHMPLNQNLVTGQWYDIKAQIEGEYLKVWVNNTLYDFGDIYPASPTFPAHGKIGLWANNAHVHFNDVLVDNLQPVPEPATIVLFGLGGLAAAFIRRKR